MICVCVHVLKCSIARPSLAPFCHQGRMTPVYQPRRHATGALCVPVRYVWVAWLCRRLGCLHVCSVVLVRSIWTEAEGRGAVGEDKAREKIGQDQSTPTADDSPRPPRGHTSRVASGAERNSSGSVVSCCPTWCKEAGASTWEDASRPAATGMGGRRTYRTPTPPGGRGALTVRRWG